MQYSVNNLGSFKWLWIKGLQCFLVTLASSVELWKEGFHLLQWYMKIKSGLVSEEALWEEPSPTLTYPISYEPEYIPVVPIYELLDWCPFFKNISTLSH